MLGAVRSRTPASCSMADWKSAACLSRCGGLCASFSFRLSWLQHRRTIGCKALTSSSYVLETVARKKVKVQAGMHDAHVHKADL